MFPCFFFCLVFSCFHICFYFYADCLKVFVVLENFKWFFVYLSRDVRAFMKSSLRFLGIHQNFKRSLQASQDSGKTRSYLFQWWHKLTQVILRVCCWSWHKHALEQNNNKQTMIQHRVGGGSGGAGGAGGTGSIYGSIAVIPPVGTLLQVTAVNAHGNSESVFIDATSFVGLTPESQKGPVSNFEFTPTLGILIGMIHFNSLNSSTAGL